MTEPSPGASLAPETPSVPPHATVAVIGAGMSGLVAARDLHRRGIDVVLEAADRVGGRVLGATSALGSRLDLGGQWIGHGHHRLESLAIELGATRYEMHTPKRPTVVDGGRTVSAAAPSMILATSTLLGIEIMSRLPSPDRWDTTTGQQWLQKTPSRHARRLLEVTALLTSTADLDRISVRAFIAMIRYQGGLTTMLATAGGAQEALLVEGIGSLVDGLAAELDGHVHTGCRVESVRGQGDAVTVATSAGGVRARKVVVTVPPPVAKHISFEPALPPERIALQRNTYMGSVYKAIAVYEQPFWRERTDAELMMLGRPAAATFDTTPPGGPGHLCVLIAGPEARELDRLDPIARRAAVLAPLVDRLGREVLEPASWHEKAWHRDVFVGGGYAALPVPGTREGYFPVVSTPVGDVHWAGTETATAHAGYIEGAIEAGTRAAREVAAAL